MSYKEFKLLLIKIITIIVSTIGCSLISAWIIYTPAAESYASAGSSFGSVFAVNFLLSFFVFLTLGIMSPLADKIVVKKFNFQGIKGILTFASAYILLGIVGGIMVSFLSFQLDTILYYIRISVLGGIIFFIIQTVLQILTFKVVAKSS